MKYKTGNNPCWTCRKANCSFCEYNLCRPASMRATIQHIDDSFVEKLWREITDIAFVENEKGELVLDQPWRGFPVGEFSQDDWFYWVDKHHSKGVGWVYENISPYEQTRKILK